MTTSLTCWHFIISQNINPVGFPSKFCANIIFFFHLFVFVAAPVFFIRSVKRQNRQQRKQYKILCESMGIKAIYFVFKTKFILCEIACCLSHLTGLSSYSLCDKTICLTALCAAMCVRLYTDLCERRHQCVHVFSVIQLGVIFIRYFVLVVSGGY